MYKLTTRANGLRVPFASFNGPFRQIIFGHFRSTLTARKLTLAFSLVEMLMALLVASLLMAALAPVMTRKLGESITFEGTIPAARMKTQEMEWGDSNYCTIDSTGDFCKGTFTVPSGFNGRMTVTAIGGGGGGGAALTSGMQEFTTPGTYTFRVPEGVTELEVTMISGGGGGGAGGQIMVNEKFEKDGVKTWKPKAVSLNRYVNVTGCGGGGGAGATRQAGICYGGGGGSGAYEKITQFVGNDTVWTMHIGGGGGGGAPYGCFNGNKGGYFAGGGGGGGNNAKEEYGHGLGGGLGTSDGGAGGLACQTYDKTQDERAGYSKSAAGGGAGGNCVPEREDEPAVLHVFSSAGGYGSDIAGGGGGGGAAGTSGGGGGGGATRLLIGSNLIQTWSGGGGGGGPTCCNSNTQNWGCYGGGKGGDGVDTKTGFPSQHGKPGGAGLPNGKQSLSTTTYIGGKLVNSVFDSSKNCSGGSTESYTSGENGKPGAIMISYLSYGSGGSGGGGGMVVPMRRIKVVPGELLTVVVGKGGSGLKAGSINSSGVEIPAQSEKVVGWTENNSGQPSYIQRKLEGQAEEVIIRTGYSGSHCAGAGCASGIVGNDTSTGFFYCSAGGKMHDGTLDYNYQIPDGFSGTIGHNGGDPDGIKTPVEGGNSSSNPTLYGPEGGAGGTATTPWYGKCTPGKGGKAGVNGGKGGNATGYGCGGGGGYSLSDGGNGSGGYVRIVWNPDGVGAGAGGGSGNLLTGNIVVKSGEKLNFQIGRGGKGGRIAGNNTEASNAQNKAFINGENGKDTIFATNVSSKKVAAGGGNGGQSPRQTGSGINAEVSSGKKVSTPLMCKLGNADSLLCKVLQGEDGKEKDGGKGGNSPHTNNGGGNSVPQAAGGRGIDSGAGGGGGSTSINQTNPAINTSTGGDGASGKIILKWQE